MLCDNTLRLPVDYKNLVLAQFVAALLPFGHSMQHVAHSGVLKVIFDGGFDR